MDCSPPGSSVHGILQARILGWSHSLLQQIFQTRGSNPGILHHRQILFHLRHQESVAIVVQSLSHVRLFVTSWTAAHQPSLSFSTSQGLLKLVSVESMISSNHLILCYLLLLMSSISPSIRVFSRDLALHVRQAKYWSFSFRISPTNEYSAYWFDLLACPRGCQKSSSAPQFESIDTSALSFLYSPTCRSIHM